MSQLATIPFDSVTADALMPTGSVVTDNSNGKKYMYVENTGTASILAGRGAYHKYAQGEVDCIGDGSERRNLIAGVSVAILLADYFGFIQIWGRNLNVVLNTDDDVAEGVAIVGFSNVSGLLNSIAIGTAMTCVALGFAMTAVVGASNTVDAFITVGGS